MARVSLVALLCGCALACSGSKARPGDGGQGGQAGTGGGPLDGSTGGASSPDGALDQIANADAATDAPGLDVDLPPGTCTATVRCDPIVEVCTEDTGTPSPAGVDSCGTLWTCFTHFSDDDTLEHACPAEEVPFCGCDGVTFSRPWYCADRPYDHVGACDDGFSCEEGRVKCADPEPSCPDGQMAAVVKGCWGPCIPVSMCRCDFAWQCRRRDKYRCSGFPVFRCLEIPPPDGGTDAATD